MYTGRWKKFVGRELRGVTGGLTNPLVKLFKISRGGTRRFRNTTPAIRKVSRLLEGTTTRNTILLGGSNALPFGTNDYISLFNEIRCG